MRIYIFLTAGSIALILLLIQVWIRTWIQDFDDQTSKILHPKFFLKSNIEFFYPKVSINRTSKLHEKPLALKREHPALQNMNFLTLQNMKFLNASKHERWNFLNFLRFLWVTKPTRTNADLCGSGSKTLFPRDPMDTQMRQNEVSGCLSAGPMYEEQVQVVSLQLLECQRHGCRSLLPTLTPSVLRIRIRCLFDPWIRDG